MLDDPWISNRKSISPQPNLLVKLGFVAEQHHCLIDHEEGIAVHSLIDIGEHLDRVT